jgi:hypothetical protein
VNISEHNELKGNFKYSEIKNNALFLQIEKDLSLFSKRIEDLEMSVELLKSNQERFRDDLLILNKTLMNVLK